MKSDDLDIYGFYDIVFQNNSFWSSDYKSRVFPIDNAWNFFERSGNMNREKDCWEKYFFQYQCKAAYNYEVPRLRVPKLNIIDIKKPNEFLKEYKDKVCKVAWDTETRGLDSFNLSTEIICITISFDGKTGYYLRWKDIDPKLFGDFLDTKESIGQNIKFDSKFVILRGVSKEKIHIYYDSWNGSHCINEMQRSSLKSDAWLYTFYGGYDRELDEYLEKYSEAKKDFSLIPESLLIKYATMDAIINWQIYEAQLKKIKWIDEKFPMDNGWSLEKYYFSTNIPAIKFFLEVELEGMCVDWDLLNEYCIKLENDIKKVKKELYKIFNINEHTISFNSNNDLGVFLEYKGWQDYGRGKVKPKKDLVQLFRNKFNYEINMNRGIYLTGEGSLELWKKNGHEKEAKLILKYRELNTLMKTFLGNEKEGTGFFQYRKFDNKVHSTFGPMLTDSQRNWSKNPNLQNIPKHGSQAKWYRKIFIPPSNDFYIEEKDAAGFQLRIGAIYSQDPELIKVFTELGGDLHSMTAQSVLKRNVTFEEFIERKKEKEFKDARFKAKGINFQLEFGASAFNFAMSTIEPNWSMSEVKEYIHDNELEEKVLFFRKQMDKDLPMYKAIKDKKTFPYLWTVASDIRKKYFKKYSRLEEWIYEKTVEADNNGFVRSSFGCIRRLPQLLYQGKDDDRGKIKNWHNIAVNSPVQNYESVILTWVGYGVMQYIKDHNLKSRICGNVHDAIVLYTHKDEFYEIDREAKIIFEEDRPENKGIPQILEYDVVDYGKTNDKGESYVWGFGVEEI